MSFAERINVLLKILLLLAITFKDGFYSYMPETNNFSWYIMLSYVAVTLVVRVMLFAAIIIIIIIVVVIVLYRIYTEHL
jgi:hypothetical protein